MLLKRILSAALAAAAILAFAGCGKSSDSSSKAESSQTETQQQTTEQTTTAKSATTNASADKTAEKPVPGKLYALNQDEGDAPAISALKLNGNQVGTEEGVNGWKASVRMSLRTSSPPTGVPGLKNGDEALYRRSPFSKISN